MKKEITWTTKTGNNAKVTIELLTSEKINNDGHEFEQKTCRIEVVAEVDGEMFGYGQPQLVNHPVAKAKIGNLGMTEENYNKVMAAINEAKETEEYKQHLAEKESAKKSNEAYLAHSRMMKKAMEE